VKRMSGDGLAECRTAIRKGNEAVVEEFTLEKKQLRQLRLSVRVSRGLGTMSPPGRIGAFEKYTSTSIVVVWYILGSCGKVSKDTQG
jgi:hypothetical protein